MQDQSNSANLNLSVEDERNIKPFFDLLHRNPNLWMRTFNEEGETKIERFTAYDVTRNAVIEKIQTSEIETYVGYIYEGHKLNTPFEISPAVAEKFFDRLSRYHKNSSNLAHAFDSDLSEANFTYSLSMDSALRQFIDVLRVRNPFDWRCEAQIKKSHGLFGTYSAHDAERRVWVRKSPDGCFSGGVDVVGHKCMLEDKEAEILYARIKSQIQLSIKNEIKHLINHNLDDVLRKILGNWKITNRIADIATGEKLGFFVTAQGSYTEGRKKYNVSLEAVIDSVAKETSLKINLEINDLLTKPNGEPNLKNGHTGSYSLKKDSKKQKEFLDGALDQICHICNIEKFHRKKNSQKNELEIQSAANIL